MAQTGHSIIVTNVTSEGPRLKIWGVCEKDKYSYIEALITSLGNKLMQRQGLGPQNSISPETTYCVKYRGRYVRAKITNIHQNGVIVLLIDSGITDIVPIELVRVLYPNSKEEDFLIKCPPLANEFTLANIISVNEKWDSRTVESIGTLVKDKELMVSKFEKFNSCYLVKLLFGDHDIGNILVNKGMAKMTTLSDMFKPQMYAQQPSYKVPSVPHQQQMPVTQMPVSGYPGEQQRVIHAPHANLMPIQQNMNADNYRYGQPPYMYQQQQQQQQQQQPQSHHLHHNQPPHIHHHHQQQQQMISPRKPTNHNDDDEESQSDIFEFRTRLVQVGAVYSAFVSCVEDGPIKFSVQLEENRDQLVKLMTEIQAHKPLPIKEPPLPGSVCLARLKDEDQCSLCRAVVMATFDTRVKIYFVDFGNTDYVQHTDIYRLPPKFIKPKVLSIRICLPGLKEMNITEEVKTYFSNLVYGQRVELHVREPDGPFLIQYGDIIFNNINVKKYLKDRFPDIASVAYGHIPALTDGTKETVYISHIVSCSKFFVQLEKNASDLEKMMATINSYAATAPLLRQIDVNSLCIAPYELDNKWYRVKILKRVKDDVNVLYVDYGNEETVNVNQLREISRDLVTQMPCQAMLCVLNGFQSRSSKPQYDAAFEALTNEIRLSMTVKNAQKTCLVVDLFDITTSPPKNILMEINKITSESVSINENAGLKKSNDFEKTVPQNHQRDDVNVSTQSNVNTFRSANNDENSRNRTKSWKDDHNEQRHDNRYQQRNDNVAGGGRERSFIREGGNNNSFGRDEERNKKDGENNTFNRESRNERSFNNRDEANNSFERDGGNNPFRSSGDSGNDRFNRNGGNDRFNRGNDRFNKDGGNENRFNRDKNNDRYNREGGNDRFNRSGGSDRFNNKDENRFNRDGGNDRYNKDGGGNDNRFNRDGGNDRFNRSGGSDRFNNKDSGKTDRNNFRDGGRFNQYSQHDNRDDRGRGNKFSKRDTSDNESVSSKGSGKRSDKGGFQGKNDRDFKSNQFNKFGNDNDGFKPRNYDNNSGYNNSKPKYNRDNISNEPKEPINFDGKSEISKAKTLELSLPSIIIGNKHRCEMVYLTNLSQFYVHLIPDNEKLEELMEKIALIYDCGGVILESSKVKSNISCIAQYAEDERWYRAIIKKIDATNATVLFVDYGNVEVINIDKLKEITDEFTALPMQALPCKLFGSEKIEWTDDEITTFSDMVNEKILEIEFVAKDQDMFKVLLREVDNEITKPEIINSTFFPGVDLMKLKENIGATKVANLSQQKNAGIEFASLDSKWIDQKVTAGTRDTVIVTWFDNTDSFYCQSVSKQKEFRPMMEEIQKVYSGRKNISETLKPGCPVMAIFAQDEALYRAEIVEVKGNRNYLVQYVDFGNKATVEQRRMYPVEKRFMIIPKQGVRCSLKNIFPINGGNWTTQNSQEIEQYLYEEGEFECTYHEEKDKKYLISLSHNKIDVANSLVEKKYAMFATSSAPKSIETEKITIDESSSEITSRLDIQLLPGQTLRVKVSSVESVSKFHVQFSSADYCDQAISAYMTNNDPKVLALPSQLAVMQNQAIECALYNVKPSASLDEKLKKMVLNKDVMMYVESVDKNRLIVELYDSIGCKFQFNDDGKDIKISPVCPMPILSSTHKVNVSTANHSNSLWLQMVADAEKDEKLNREMFEFYSKNEEKADPIVNKLCVIESQGTYCRAKIIKKTDDNMVLVNLIDFGMNENISCDKLKILNNRFHLPHQLAIHVSLNVTLNGTPAEQINALKPHLIGKEFTAIFYNVHKKWIVELIENNIKLSETLTGLNLVKEMTLIENNKEKFKICVTHVDSPVQFWIQRNDEISELKEMENELKNAVNYTDVNGVLEEGSLCAAYSDGVWYRAEVIDADEDIVTVRFVDYGKTDVINNKPNFIKSLPETMKTRKIFGIKCRLDVIPVDSEEWSDVICQWMQTLKTEENIEAKIIVESSVKRIDLFLNGKSIIDTLVEDGKALKVLHEQEVVEELIDVELDPRSAFISHINSPSDFYVQEEKSVSDLEKIQDRFIVANMLPIVSDVKEGTLCVAKYTDEDYYRARIISHSETGTKVLFIDYGNNAEVQEIRVIPDDVASIPPLARKCSLKKPYYLTNWSNDAFNMFCELSADGATIFLLDVLKEDETAIVKLTLNSEDIAEKLAPAVSIFVCNINSPMEFWIQRENDVEEIDKLQEKLFEMENSEKIEAKEGLLCAAKFPVDEQWYRGRIISCNENESTVMFIDYGNSAICSEIRALPDDIAAIEPFAKKCSLKLPTLNDEWSQNAFDEFCNISGDGAVSLIIDIVEEKNNLAIVNLFLGKENIAEKLICKGNVEEKLSTIVEDNHEEEIISEKEITSQEEIVLEKEITPQEENVSQKEIKSQEETVSQNEILEEPTVFISQINSVEEFWIQRLDYEDKLDEIACQLCAFEDEAAVKEPKVGSIYAALFTCDDAWYRGKVLSINGNEINVFFIDYGNSSIVTDLRELSKELVNLPSFAKKCSLKLPKDQYKEWPKDAVKQLTELSADGTCPFTLCVLDDNDTALVDLKLNNESITKKLLESVEKITNESKLEEKQENLEKIEKTSENDVEEIVKNIEAVKLDEKITKSNDDSSIIDESCDKIEEISQSVENLQVSEKLSEEIATESSEETIKLTEETMKLDGEILPMNEEITKIDESPEISEKSTIIEEKNSTILLWNIISPSEFWGQVGDDSANIQDQLLQADEWKTIDELEKNLLCAAKVNDEWHRARIEKINENSTEIFLIDQGFTCVSTEFRQLPSALVNVEPLSKKYSLQLPKNINNWTQSAITAFSKYTKQSFTMEILQPDEISIIKLLHHDEDVAEILTSMRDDFSISERLPPEGEENLNMSISNMISPSMFWGQLELNSLKLEEMEKNLINVASFNELKNFNIGRICAALFPDDGNWYRAKILSHSNKSTEVFYVDFGNTSTTTELRALPHDLIAIEYLSTQYSLRKPLDIEEWSEEACDKFHELIANGETYFEYKILDQEKKEVQLILQGKDVVEILSPLCKKVTSELTKDSTQLEHDIETIDLTNDTSLKEIVEEKNITASSDSAFHSENIVETSYSSQEMETPVEKKSQEFSSTFQDLDQRDVSSEFEIQPELTSEDIISKMLTQSSDNTKDSVLDVSLISEVEPELTPEDVINKMTVELPDGTIVKNVDDPLSELNDNEKTMDQKNICEAEDNQACEISSTITENKSTTVKAINEIKESFVKIVRLENFSEALPEVEITNERRKSVGKLENIAEVNFEIETITRRKSLTYEEKILPACVSGDQPLTREDKILSSSVDGSCVPLEKTIDNEIVPTEEK
ncbi:maternal protein tudor-like isoform X2 [Leptopilina boulardi]|uniref:maternal protein tudor-like isoform X2 n=1 Tax=Leptopilina boulardi TaxID=63433 RepID=UPI0021F5703D|nr:maternal protein tudor-like isoform X2 [Leptopilina boulardi]